MMVRAIDHQLSIQKTKSLHLKKMFDIQSKSSRLDHGVGDEETLIDQRIQLQAHNILPKVGDRLYESHYIGSPLDRPRPDNASAGARAKSPRDNRSAADLEMMKERFAKLLLGEDMSGGGKGVSSALALSNAITNLAASVFGEQKKLEPMAPETKMRWRKEIDWLLSVTDHIVEFVPAQQSNNGINMEIMTTRQRSDLLMNIPALRKLDTILIDLLDQFGNQKEFWYVSRGSDGSEQETPPRNDDRWWIPTVKVPQQGLSDVTRRWLQFQKDSVNQVLKAAMAINAQVLSEMEVPENYIESLPKNGRASLGDSVYKSITLEYFDPEQFLSFVDLSTEHKVLDLKNRIEASIVIWKRKMNQKDGKSSWSTGVSLEKRELFEERVETILLILKQRFPGIAQSALDISKIQYNKDVGQAILESYSRIIESLAFNILSRIEDVLYADSLVHTPRVDACERYENDRSDDETDTPTKTLSEFMGWTLDRSETTTRRSNAYSGDVYCSRGENEKNILKPIATMKKFSYLEKLENLGGFRSPKQI